MLDPNLVDKYGKALVTKSFLKKNKNKFIKRLDIHSNIENLIAKYCLEKKTIKVTEKYKAVRRLQFLRCAG